MARLTIDGKEVEVPKGTTVLQAAEKVGVFVPHYCYHDGLSISGNCRMCLVEVEGMPKLTTSCTQPVSDGMVVHTSSDKVKSGQGDVLEFLLKNHPLDCPVCDQAGECLLQDYHMAYDAEDSRLDEKKNRKAKAKSIGPRIVLDQERCILCTRCVRFLDEVTHTNELGVFGRGSKERLDIFPGVEVDNDYDVNIVDLCPVGALTDKDFRFKVRSWYLTNATSICDGCSTGCAIFVDHNEKKLYKNNGERVVRYRPRFNPEVNGHWMCNHGRYTYKKHEKDRLTAVRTAAEGWGKSTDEVVASAGRSLKEAGGSVGFIVAPNLSNEEAWLLKAFVASLGGGKIGTKIPGLVKGASPEDAPIDGLLRRADPWPNSRGLALILGDTDRGAEVSGILGAASTGTLSHVVVMGVDLTTADIPKDLLTGALSKATSVAFVSHAGPMVDLVDVAVPIATHVGRDGTFTNYAGLVQAFLRVVPPMGESVSLFDVLAAWTETEGTPEDVFAALSKAVPALSGTPYDDARADAAEVKGTGTQWSNKLVVPQL